MNLRNISIALAAAALFGATPAIAETTLLNVSYDPTRELYQEFNAAFDKQWQAKGGEKVTVKQSHGGSGRQARSVIDGLEADVVTLALAYDIDAIAEKAKVLPTNWQARLPHNSSPYTSTIVFLSWENEAFLAVKELGPDKFEIVVPSLSILAEPPIVIVDKVVDKHGTRKVAQAYLEYWYTPEGQEIAAKNYYRPIEAAVAKKYEKQFTKTTLFKLSDYFGDWQKAQKTHFADGGVFDQIYRPAAK